MPKTITYDSLHYCVVCDDCGALSDYDGRIGNTELCQHVNTTADYECNCNVWTMIIIDDLFDKWVSDRRYLRKNKYDFQIVDCVTRKVLKKTDRFDIQKGPGLVDIIAGTDNSEFAQKWTLSGPSLTVHHKSLIRDAIYTIRSGRN